MISARLQRLIVSALLAAAVLAVYAPLVGSDFINLDDAEYVRENAAINSGFSWAGVKWAFENPVAGNWHPVTMLSHMLDCQLYGLKAGRHHLTNVLFHLANTLLLFWLLLAMTGGNVGKTAIRPGKLPPTDTRVPSNLWPCALVAALFGLHPLHVESVAWVSERKDVLSSFFFLLTLWSYTCYTRKRAVQNSPVAASSSPVQPWKPWLWYILALTFFTLGLMSKAMLVTLPFVLLLLDYWPLGRFLVPSRSPVGKAARVAPPPTVSLTWLLLEKAPFLALAAIFSFITYSVQQTAGAVIDMKYFPLDARLANAVVSYAHYVGRTVWPTSLAMLYPYQNWTTAQIAGSTVLFAGLSWLAIWSARRRPYVFVGWFWFAGMLIPVIGLVQVGLQVMADRYTYLPLIGIFIALAWGLAELAASPGRRMFVISGAMLAIVLILPATALQVRYWKNSQTLFEHTVAVTGHSTVANYILGALADSQGRTDEAMARFNSAIQDDPGNVKARCGLAYLLGDQGKLDEAAAQYYAALRVAPDSAKAHFGLAEVLIRQHLPDEAMDHYNLALQANPNIAEAHYQLAALCGAHHDTGSAITHLQAAIRLAPDWPLPFNNLAWILATQPESQFRNGPEATKLALHAVTLTGENPGMLDTLAAAYAESGQFANAVATAQSAIQKAGDSGQTNLASEIESHLKSFQSEHALRE